MPQRTYRHAFPDRFIVGTVGQPGQQTFFVQARQGSRLTSVVCEKHQVQVLSQHLEQVLDELSRSELTCRPIPPRQDNPRDLEPLDVPVEPDFRVGTMTIAYHPGENCLHLELFAFEDLLDEDLEYLSDEDRFHEVLEVLITPEQAREFVARSQRVISAGRPHCPFCAQVIEADGHICPRANGYRRLSPTESFLPSPGDLLGDDGSMI